MRTVSLCPKSSRPFIVISLIHSHARSFILKCLEAYFPETLNILLIHNAPWIFQGIWRILAPMIDPVVRTKIVRRLSLLLTLHIPTTWKNTYISAVLFLAIYEKYRGPRCTY